METTVQLDLKRDFTEIYDYLAECVRCYDPAVGGGLGDPGPVKLIEVGYEYSQAGWVLAVFDTRPDAEPDGEWTSLIEGNEFNRPHWLAAGEANMDGPITLVGMDGVSTVLPEGTELAEPLGKLVKAVVIKARADGLFAALPKAAGCELGVEHFGGAYCWPEYESRGEENLA
jgi:hypothetical protein